ncbi:TetR/AcrR family transcriptional regulator [Dysgonomonas sp. ZJ279]|uniref:TetR/AcrR family transcriptional regulator n=1 Tax=Dysgonomonas sp. ZJ279 TaxID=2709796 RepID=UPI0013EAFF0A|nr:TetR/AcrR family transcriptional regulator [Dysgonomonas sp. ZJ279]
MKYSREYILRNAFDVFMTKGYDSASISVLQKELNMSRGVLYRYFESKEELFLAVIDEYFFKVYDRISQNVDVQKTTETFIETMHRRQKLMATVFIKSGVTHIAFLNYTALIIQAAKHYPNFVTRFKEIYSRIVNNWEIVLKNSIESKEIRADIDIKIMSTLFVNACLKETSDQDFDESKFALDIMRDIDRRKEVMDYLFTLIKV